MADFHLTEQQQGFLRSIAAGLQEGIVENEWIIQKERDTIMRIRGIPQDQSWDATWRGIVGQADIDDFVEYGFLRRKSSNRYTLAVQKIIDAVENKFGNDTKDQLQKNVAGETMVIKPAFRLPSQSFQFACDIFMIMPFAEEFQPIYDDHIRPLIENEGLLLKRGDDFFSSQAIMDDIWAATNQCKLVIADCTGKNPNVFYELGIAHTLGKPAIMITQNMDDIPFDLRHLRVIQYEYTPRGMNEFEEKLKAAVLTLISDQNK